MLEENIHSTIIRLFSGEANTEEKKQIQEWLSQSDENRKIYTDLQEIWLSAGNKSEYNTEHAITVFRERISRKKQQVRRLYDVLKYAAIIVLLISLPVMYYIGNQSATYNETYTTIECAMGDKSTVTLPDGSLVYLNSGTKLTFNNNFQGKFRNVSIDGEAYFSVVKNKDIPFRVKASDIEIEVLGTSFNIKAYPEENTISTTLVEGSVKISSKYQQTIMEPSQKVVYSYDSNTMKLYKLDDTTPETEWKDGRLVFRNETLEELAVKLERWFDVDIVFADEQVKERRFTGVIERESILEAISYFGISKHVGYEINNNEIKFYTKK